VAIWSTFSRGATNAISSTFLIGQQGDLGARGQHIFSQHNLYCVVQEAFGFLVQ